MEDMTSFRMAGEITDIELKLNPCPLCGRKPELVSYNADSRANPNFKKHFRFVCSHGLADAPSYKTHPYDMVYKCQEDQYDLVCVEDINLKAISNNEFHLGKSTNDNGYGMFRNMLAYKLKERGRYFVRVGKFFPSTQLCSNCGRKHKYKYLPKYHGNRLK